jgi:F0F1-type ATP synthase assembly protein I
MSAPTLPEDPAPPENRDPDDRGPDNKNNPWVQVGRYSQLAMMLPAGTVAGWFLGSALDRWLHTSWINVVGLLLGTAAGLIEVIRTVLRDSK